MNNRIKIGSLIELSGPHTGCSIFRYIHDKQKFLYDCYCKEGDILFVVSYIKGNYFKGTFGHVPCYAVWYKNDLLYMDETKLRHFRMIKNENT